MGKAIILTDDELKAVIRCISFTVSEGCEEQGDQDLQFRLQRIADTSG